MAANPTPLAEAEVKYALSAEEFRTLPVALERLAFTPGPVSRLTDNYLHYEPSARGGWDYTRLRLIEDKGYRLTRKQWTRDAQGQPVRLEEEHAINAKEAQRLLAEASAPVTLVKTRREFFGALGTHHVTVALDDLLLGDSHRYFLECEVMTAPEQAQAMRAELTAWIHAALPVKAREEAPTMLEIVREYLGKGEG